MTRTRTAAGALIAFGTAAWLGATTFGQGHSGAMGPAIHRPESLQWQEGPASLPPGAKIAVLDGDPNKAGPFVMRFKFPDGYRVAPHTHPTIENVTVLTGTFLAGMGEQFSESNLHAFRRDGFASIPANHAHYAMARGQTIVQVHAIGPFALTYVNPADDPRKQ